MKTLRTKGIKSLVILDSERTRVVSMSLESSWNKLKACVNQCNYNAWYILETKLGAGGAEIATVLTVGETNNLSGSNNMWVHYMMMSDVCLVPRAECVM